VKGTSSRWGCSGGLTRERDGALDDAHHIGFRHDEEVLTVDLCAGPFCPVAFAPRRAHLDLVSDLRELDQTPVPHEIRRSGTRGIRSSTSTFMRLEPAVP
jgi:hypothetical protein